MTRGLLIAIEGSDGIGKTTQMDILRRRLLAAGVAFVPYDLPRKSGTPVGDLIGGFLAGRHGRVAPEFLALAFAMDRMGLRDGMLADLDAGRHVLCDRYVESNVALQSAKILDTHRRKALQELIEYVEFGACSLPRPDLQIVMTAGAGYFEAGRHLERGHDGRRAYAGGGPDVHEADFAMQARADAHFAAIAASRRTRHVRVLDDGARRTPEDVAGEVWAIVSEAIAGGPGG